MPLFHNCIFFKWANPASFIVYFWVFSNKHHYNFYNNYMWKNAHSVYSAGIWTHDLTKMSCHPKPLDQGSRSIVIQLLLLAVRWQLPPKIFDRNEKAFIVNVIQPWSDRVKGRQSTYSTIMQRNPLLLLTCSMYSLKMTSTSFVSNGSIFTFICCKWKEAENDPFSKRVKKEDVKGSF